MGVNKNTGLNKYRTLVCWQNNNQHSSIIMKLQETTEEKIYKELDNMYPV